MASWLVAWRRYGVAAVATEQMSFPEVLGHEAVVVEVVALHKAEGYGPLLGPMYDECAR